MRHTISSYNQDREAKSKVKEMGVRGEWDPKDGEQGPGLGKRNLGLHNAYYHHCR